MQRRIAFGDGGTGFAEAVNDIVVGTHELMVRQPDLVWMRSVDLSRGWLTFAA